MNATIALQRFLGAAVNFISAVFLSILLYITISNIARAADYVQVPGSPVPGHLVDVGTHKLHIYCQGQGSPTVIVDTGLGEISLEWKHVQEGLAANSRICLYDRAGCGSL